MFTSISRSLFESHKKLYSFLICCAIKRQANSISTKEWNLFTKGAGITPKTFKESYPNPDAIKITPDSWYYLHKLTEIKGLENLLTDLKSIYPAYKEYFSQTSIFGKSFPGK
jgi:dynein heavy chain